MQDSPKWPGRRWRRRWGGGSAARFASRVIIGGTASKLAGGSFQNGAVTAAFAYLYNECGHGGCTTKLEQALYDYWPGYKLGTCVNNGDCTAGQWTMASVETAIDIAAGGAGQEFKAAIAGVREIYKAGIKDLGAFGMDLVRAGGDPEMVARLVVDMRNQLKDIGRGPLASLLKGWHQPSADQLLKEKGSWLNVIQGSQRSNAGWNKALGAAQ